MKFATKALLQAIFLLPLLVPSSVFAQDASASNDREVNTQAYTELLKTDVQTKREAISTEILQLNDADAKVFWPIFREYDAELAKVNASLTQALQQYVKDYQTATDEEADQLLSQALDLEAQRAALKKSYFAKVKAALSARLAARFFEVENQLQFISDLQVAANLPTNQ
jgi:hypothetical protein